MAEFSSPPAEIQFGLRACEKAYGRETLLAIDPSTICMIGGPGTEYCLLGRCQEIAWAKEKDLDGKPRQPKTIASIDFYVEGSDERTEVCRGMLADYQKFHR
jgi:hypothetical protein